MHNRRLHFMAILTLVCVASSASEAQQAVLGRTGNATFLSVEGSMRLHEQFGAALATGYSIAGVLEMGMTFGLDVRPSDGLARTDVGLVYAVTPLTQRTGVPVSVRLSGAYTARSDQSDFLARNSLIREARGYQLGIEVARDVRGTDAFGVRFGVRAGYTNYLETTSVGFNTEGFTGTSDVDYAEFPKEELESELRYGGYVAALFALPPRGVMTTGVGVYTDSTWSVEIRPLIEIAFNQ